MELYVLRDLTRETDRLPAISGLARLAGYSHKDYYAGLWRQGLAAGLSWFRNMNDVGSTSDTKNAILMQQQGPAARNPSYTAPSWSWATRKQSVSFSFDSDDEDCRMEARSIDASITLKGLNPFGQVENGSLRICGKVITLPARNCVRVRGRYAELLTLSPQKRVRQEPEDRVGESGLAVNYEAMERKMGRTCQWCYLEVNCIATRV